MLKRLSVGALVALVLALAIGGTVLAQGPIDGEVSGRAPGVRRLAMFAKKLDMTAEDVMAAIEAGTLKDLLPEDAQRPARRQPGGNRELSDEQIAKIAERLDLTVEDVEAAIEAGTLKDLLPEDAQRPARRQPGGDRELSDEQIAKIAERLDLTVEDVEAAIESGTLKELFPGAARRPARRSRRG